MAVKKTDTDTPKLDDTDLRLNALDSASRVVPPGHASEVLSVAQKFLAFLKGEDTANG